MERFFGEMFWKTSGGKRRGWFLLCPIYWKMPQGNAQTKMSPRQKA